MACLGLRILQGIKGTRIPYYLILNLPKNLCNILILNFRSFKLILFQMNRLDAFWIQILHLEPKCLEKNSILLNMIFYKIPVVKKYAELMKGHVISGRRAYLLC
ncbi:hypothetical protein ACJX0J_034473 [Zea mays]